MKIFEFKNNNDYEYPEDMEKLLSYLNDVGTINPCISGKTIEKLYREYSDTYCAGWLNVDGNTLEDFAEWLSKKEI